MKQPSARKEPAPVDLMKTDSSSMMGPTERRSEEASDSERADMGGYHDSLRISLLCFTGKARESRLIKAKLASNEIDCALVHAGSPAEFQAALGRKKFDLVISTFLPTSYDGMAALSFARAVQPHAPFLYVSDPGGEGKAVESLKSGTTDFISRGHGESLASAVRHILAEAAQHLQGWQSEEMLRRGDAHFPRPADSSTTGEPELTEREMTDWQLLLQSTALAAASNGILITGRDGLILWANSAFSKLTGFSLEEIVGKNPRIFKSDKHDPSFYREFWGTILSGQTWRGNFTNRRKDGSLYIVQQTVTPVFRSNGQINHYISITEDITDRKHLEEQLLQAQKMEAVGQLAAGVAHEFNNLLTVIRCNSELLFVGKDRLTLTESADLLEHIMKASDRGAKLTRELVGFCQEHIIQWSEFSLNEIVETRARVLRQACRRDIKWQCNYAPDLPLIRADARMIQQLLTNLTSNAINAMPHGGRIIISTEKVVIASTDLPSHPQAQPGEFVCLSVRDTGCGIAPENLPRIFEPFFTTNEPGKGTGLGLAVAYGIVKQHHGWIDVASKLAHGTTFTVFLPAPNGSAAPAANKSFPA